MSRPGYGTVTDTVETAPAEESADSHPEEPSSPGSAPGEAGDEPAILSKDEIFDVLRNRRRRLVLEFSRDRESTTLPELAEHVASVENEKPRRQLTSYERKRVYVGLYQCHLPRLAQAGVIDYDPDSKTVELLEPSAQLYPYLDLECGSDPDGGGRRGWLSVLTSFLSGE